MSKHTPGPWAYTWNEGSTNDGHVYTQTGTLGIAIVEGSNWGAWRDADDGGEAEFEANARLIAAAPDMYEALKALKYNQGNEAWTLADAALRKADGA